MIGAGARAFCICAGMVGSPHGETETIPTLAALCLTMSRDSKRPKWETSMRRNRQVLASIGLTLSVLASCDVLAAAQRTFVASSGNDANPCSLILPCRGFAAAVAQTNAGGEVIVLDSAGYGPVAIAKSISITAPAGIYAGISATSGDAITITGGSVVELRGLTLVGAGASIGIDALNAAQLRVERVAVSNFGRGLFFGGAGTLVVRDSSFDSNYEVGIHVEPLSGVALVTVERSSMANNGANGMALAGTTRGTVSQTAVTDSGNVGFLIDAGAHVSLSDCRSVRRPDLLFRWGIMVRGTGSKAQIARCEIVGNAVAVYATDHAYAAVVDTTALASTDWTWAGFFSDTGSTMDIERSTAQGFAIAGFMVSNASFGEPQATIRVSNSMAIGNGNGFYNNGGNGVFETRGNNTVRGNGSNPYAPYFTTIGGY